ncbi:MAG: SUMF1/EgtB/PvdO family nonheme iron enzyme [Anaerolineae bacterium]|nr:SUMF1/EgtB/PvdO family nonheme iron enzyme [Anaerolineae bacterium]
MTSTDPREPLLTKLPDLVGQFLDAAAKLKNEFLFFAILFLVLSIGAEIFAPQWMDKGGRVLLYVVLALAFLAFLLALFEPALSARLAAKRPQGKVEAPGPANPTTELPNYPTASLPNHPTTQPALSPDALRTCYLESLIGDCRRARLIGLDPSAADPTRGGMTLERLYVALDTKTQVQVDKKDEKRERNALSAERETRPLSALEALARAPERRMVLLGLPGAGKSTLVRYLALRMAQALIDRARNLVEELPGWTRSPLLPLIVPLGRLAESIPAGTQHGTAALIERFIRASLDADERLKGYGDALLDELRSAGGLICFDGLDEVADLRLRPVVREAVEQFAAQYDRSGAAYLLVTCRTFSYTDAAWQLADWPRHELAPLDADHITAFVNAWHAELTRVDPARAEDSARKRDRLLEALRPGDRRRLAEIAPNPLILTVMAVVHTHKGDLPDTRAQVYEECIDLFLTRWELERTVLGRTQKRSLLEALGTLRGALDDVLREVAYKAHEGGARLDATDQAALVTEDLLAGVLQATFGDEKKMRTFLDYSEGANGLLMLQGTAPLPDAPVGAKPRRVYAFPHLTFEEYLAGRYLGGLPNLGQQVRAHLERSDRWREPVMFLGEHLCFASGDSERVDTILDKLTPADPPMRPVDADWRAVWMAADLLMLYRRRWPSRPSPHDARIVARLAALVDAGALAPVERAAAGRALAVLNDPRPGVRVSLPLRAGEGTGMGVPDLLWCPVPAGPFVMGASKEGATLAHPFSGEALVIPPDGQAYDDEGPVHIQDIPYDYWISRYPITNAQFQCFADDGGYESEQWWTKSGWGWRQQNKRSGPARYGGAFELDNHPVVGVTWYEAAAFCRWLEEKIKIANCKLHDVQGNPLAICDSPFVIRLPGEAEWEKAARGGLLIPTTQPPNNLTIQHPNPNPARRYPWGNDPDPDRANYDRTGIGSTSAVGCFPGGASPYGCQDMSGNVWEWCATQWEGSYRNYKNNNDVEGTERRVLRGGAFDFYDWYARCAYRYFVDPDDEYRYFGFRVVVASPVLTAPSAR